MRAVNRRAPSPFAPRCGRARALGLVLALALGAAVPACAPGASPAEQALSAVEKSWGDVRVRVHEVAPHRAQEIELALVRARASAKEGDWIGTLAAVQGLPGQIERLSVEIEAGERARDAEWDRANASLAEALPQVDAGIERVAARRPLPAGVTRDDVAAARSELEAARIAWTHAVSARGERRWDEAMNRAGEARLRARRALERVGLPSLPALEPRREATRPSTP
jgi:hypothetical protein